MESPLLLSQHVSPLTLSRQPRLQRQPGGIPAVEELQTLPRGRAHPPPASHEGISREGAHKPIFKPSRFWNPQFLVEAGWPPLEMDEKSDRLSWRRRLRLVRELLASEPPQFLVLDDAGPSPRLRL